MSDERGGFGDRAIEVADLHAERSALLLRAPGTNDLAIDDERARRGERRPDHLALGWVRDQRGSVAREQVGVVGDITEYLYDEREARQQTVEVREGWGTARRVGTLVRWARHRGQPGWWGLVIDRTTGEAGWHSAGGLHPFSEFG